MNQFASDFLDFTFGFSHSIFMVLTALHTPLDLFSIFILFRQGFLPDFSSKNEPDGHNMIFVILEILASSLMSSITFSRGLIGRFKVRYKNIVFLTNELKLNLASQI